MEKESAGEKLCYDKISGSKTSVSYGGNLALYRAAHPKLLLTSSRVFRKGKSELPGQLRCTMRFDFKQSSIGDFSSRETWHLRIIAAQAVFGGP